MYGKIGPRVSLCGFRDRRFAFLPPHIPIGTFSPLESGLYLFRTDPFSADFQFVLDLSDDGLDQDTAMIIGGNQANSPLTARLFFRRNDR